MIWVIKKRLKESIAVAVIMGVCGGLLIIAALASCLVAAYLPPLLALGAIFIIWVGCVFAINLCIETITDAL